MDLANKTTTINDLCDDLLCQIFDRLSVKQVMAIQRVNKAFHRSAKTWFKSVDKLDVADRYFSLSKSNGSPIEGDDDCFSTSRLKTFSYVYRLFNTFTGIKNVSIAASSVINSSQMVQLVSRCPNIDQFSLNLYDLRFDDDDWTLLVEFIKHCDIKLKVSQFDTSPNLAKHLEQLFAVAERIKSVEFNNLKVDSIMTIAGLNESVEISLNFCEFPDQMATEPEAQRRLADLVSRRVDNLKVNTNDMQNLSARVFLRLTHLEINLSFFRQLIPAGFEFPRLNHLTINGSAIASFFVNVPKMEQLKQLKILPSNFLKKEEHLNVMLEKTANISELEVAWKSMNKPEKATLDFLVKLFRLLSLTLPRLRTLRVDIQLELVSKDHFKQLLEPLIALAEERPEVRLKLEFSGGKEYGGFKRIAENMPGNVKINWALIDR